jgi:hypothetical protein
MLLERRTVSRKTPGDGKLEVTHLTADAVAGHDQQLSVELAGTEAPASVVSMSCTCAKGAGQHDHLFLQSDLLRSLVSGTEVDLHLDGLSRVRVTPAR